MLFPPDGRWRPRCPCETVRPGRQDGTLSTEWICGSVEDEEWRPTRPDVNRRYSRRGAAEPLCAQHRRADFDSRLLLPPGAPLGPGYATHKKKESRSRKAGGQAGAILIRPLGARAERRGWQRCRPGARL
ncbi:hypothetical protein NDU88_004550 [Pleurodeles waltl]|uniref:Uncharacterized protein n=1 Tax=Pleurodeles waltl TaxID=8319 RepID=A0AAV7M8P1_PLEWA|nr:hypothetical protein NDU88_004550 [Pleurodeles waltl]